MKPETEEQAEIRDEQAERAGERVAQFLADPAIESAFERLASEYHAKWKDTMNPVDREALWSKSRALDDLKLELQRVVDSGRMASHNRDIRRRTREREARKPRT